MTHTAASERSKYCILTYGCQMNDNDSEIMSGILEARGFVPADSEEDADVILVNTCVVRGGAEDRAIGRLENFAALKRRRPHVLLGVTGCMAQKDGEELLGRLPHVDMVIGTRDLFRLGEILDTAACGGAPIVATADIDRAVFSGNRLPVKRKSSVRALVAVMYGCNNFCTYCIVPHTRGREVSRPLHEILDEVRMLADQGCLEVTLVGQNVNSYLSEGRDFADLLGAVNDVPGIERIRFITSHPKDCSDRLIAAATSLPHVCTNFHLPAQAGSDRVLERMGRGYTKSHYLDLLARIRAAIPTAAITTDIIVGFPGEMEEDFEETRDLIEKARWDSAFIFMYSPRPGTAAADWPDTVPPAEKKLRLQQCLARQEEISGEINRAMEGSTHEILVEGISRKSPDDLVGRTRGDKSVVVRGGVSPTGALVNVRITKGYPHTLFGEIPA